MRRFLLAVVLFTPAVASAEPLPWSYYVRLTAGEGKDRILLGIESPPSPNDDAPPRYFTTTLGGTQSDSQTPVSNQRLFTFSYGGWTESDAPPPPETTSSNQFTLLYDFSLGYDTASGSATGRLSASGMYTSGTGNFWVSLNASRDIALGGRRARVTFSGENTENLSAVVMTVTELPVAETPEPATLLLAGVGLAGIGVWQKRRTK